jgi:tRNA (mo5U34)-methyltransferase
LDIAALRKERQKWLTWKNILPRQEAVASLPNLEVSRVMLGDSIAISFKEITLEQQQQIEQIARVIEPWRKGPFTIGNLHIDSEWQSFIKYNLLEPHFDLKDKIVGDIGCNNGYYLFRMLTQAPKKLIGFDPSAIMYTQFQFINHFVQSNIIYELLGVEHIEYYEHQFDVLFCLGVLYHRPDPIGMLKSLYKGLNPSGELILDTFMIDGEEEICLSPQDRYSKIPNIYFIPTISALKNWCSRAGFESVEILDTRVTDSSEQRKTEWVNHQSLEDFLDSNDPTKTVEGYPAPKRVYLKAIKKSKT